MWWDTEPALGETTVPVRLPKWNNFMFDFHGHFSSKGNRGYKVPDVKE